MIPILGFTPDADQTTPGVISDCSNMVPTLIGMKGAPAANTPTDVPALADPCQGAAVVALLDNSRRVLAGTQDAIYELESGAWTDVSRGTAYTGAVESRWSITQFGDSTLMANGADPIQRSTGGVFADISGAPIAEIVFSVGSFVMALNVNDGATKPDGWHCCAAFDDTDWTESITTQSASGRLVTTPGPITAGAKLGEYAVAYKSRSLFLGQYVGAPVVWDWIPISGGTAGCVGKDALCDVNGTHFFVGEDNFWLFDGTRPTPIGDGAVRFWFKENASATYLYKTVCTFDKLNNLVYVFYVSRDGTELDSALVYHIQSKKWGRSDMVIQASLEYVSPGITIDGLASISATIDGLPSIPFDSQYWAAGGRSMSIVSASGQLQTLTGSSVSSSFTTGDSGDDDNVILLRQLRIRYAKAPTSATVQTFNKMNSGENYSNGPTGSMNDGKFDTLNSARWHKARFSFTGDVHVTAVDAKYQPDGQR